MGEGGHIKRPPVFLQSGGSCLSTIVLTISLIPGFDISAISKGAARGRTKRGEGKLLTPAPLNFSYHQFLTISLAFHWRFPRFFYLPYTSCSFLRGVKTLSNSLPTPPPLEDYQWPRAKKRKKKDNITVLCPMNCVARKMWGIHDAVRAHKARRHFRVSLTSIQNIPKRDL